MDKSDQDLSRRNLLKLSAAGVAAVVATTACGKQDGGGAAAPKKIVQPKNAQFYKADGSFDGESAKKAYYEMMERFNYPISDFLKSENFWVADFLQRDYEKLGMAGVFWLNKKGKYGETGEKKYKGDFVGKSFGYLGHDIYLLPGQMLPEHHHIGGPDGYGPKMECWLVRHGSVDFFGECASGEETLIKDMPEAERPWGFGEDWFKSKYVAKRTEKDGKVYVMDDPESWHFQRAGAEGAIVTEFATYHNHVSFSKPGMEFGCSKAKA